MVCSWVKLLGLVVLWVVTTGGWLDFLKKPTERWRGTGQIDTFERQGNTLKVYGSSSESTVFLIDGRVFNGLRPDDTFEDVKKASLILYEYCKQQQEKEKGEKKIKEDSEIDQSFNSSLSLDEMFDEEVSEELEKDLSEESNEENNQSQTSTLSAGDSYEDGVVDVRTADSLEDKLKDLVNTQGLENVYVEIPKVNLDNIIASNVEIHEEFDRYWKYETNLWKQKSDECRCHFNVGFDEVDAEFHTFKREAQKEVSYLVKGANVKFAFAEDQEQVDKFISVQKKLKRKIKIFYEDGRGLRQLKDSNIIDMKNLINEGKKILEDSPKKYDSMINNIEGDLDAILCTTSGTTSNPKLATLPANKFIQHISNYLKVDPKNSSDEYVSVLPFPWIMEQVYGVGFNLLSGMKVNFPENADTAMEDLKEIGPTFMLGAPRLWEQISADMRARILDSSKLTQWIFNTMVDRGLKAVDSGKRDFWADKLLFTHLKDRLGFSKVTSAATGGSAIGPDTFKFFLAMGIPLRQLYGQTELMGAYTLQNPPAGEMDCETVGEPFPDCQIKILNPDANGMGEIITKHPNMFSGYYNNKKALKESIKNGWMYTGDAGFIDNKNRLTVVDRVDDIATKSDGIKFSPQNIENKLKFSPYVGEAVILGSKKPYLTAIICIRFSIVSKLAEKWQLPFTSYTGLAADKKIYDLIQSEIEKVNKNQPNNLKIEKFLR